MGLNGVPASGQSLAADRGVAQELGLQRGFVVTDAGAAFDLTTHG